MADIHESRRLLNDEAASLRAAKLRLYRGEASHTSPEERHSKVGQMLLTLQLEMRFLREGVDADQATLRSVAGGVQKSKDRLNGIPSLAERYDGLLESTENIDTGYTSASDAYKNLGSVVAQLIEDFGEARTIHRDAVRNEEQLERVSLPALAYDMESAAARL